MNGLFRFSSSFGLSSFFKLVRFWFCWFVIALAFTLEVFVALFFGVIELMTADLGFDIFVGLFFRVGVLDVLEFGFGELVEFS